MIALAVEAVLEALVIRCLSETYGFELRLENERERLVFRSLMELGWELTLATDERCNAPGGCA